MSGDYQNADSIFSRLDISPNIDLDKILEDEDFSQTKIDKNKLKLPHEINNNHPDHDRTISNISKMPPEAIVNLQIQPVSPN